MHTQRWTQDLDEITTAARQEFGATSPEILNRKPDATTWSVAEILDHIIAVNSTYFPVIDRLHRNDYDLPWHARFGFLVRWLGGFILGSVQPDRRRRMKTFPIWEPRASAVEGDIVSRFSDHQEQLKNAIAGSSDLLDRGVVISSPANRNIVYTLETAFDIIVSHERRHLEQAREVMARVQTAV